MVEVFILAVWLGIIGGAFGAVELWGWIQDRHAKAVAQRIQARRMANKKPREKERVDYWAA